MTAPKLRVPADEPAERAVIGVAINHPDGYRAARTLLTADDFWDHRYRRLFAACDQIAGETNWEERPRAAARIAEVPTDLVLELVDQAPVMVNCARWARRVARRAAERRAIQTCADIHNALGAGRPPGDLLAAAAGVIENLQAAARLADRNGLTVVQGLAS